MSGAALVWLAYTLALMLVCGHRVGSPIAKDSPMRMIACLALVATLSACTVETFGDATRGVPLGSGFIMRLANNQNTAS